MRLLSFQGIGLSPPRGGYPIPKSVTYVSERLLPMSPVCTQKVAGGQSLAKTTGRVRKDNRSHPEGGAENFSRNISHPFRVPLIPNIGDPVVCAYASTTGY